MGYYRPSCQRFCRLLLLLTFITLPAAAAPDTKGILSLAIENDLFADVDRHYTHGTRLSWLSPETDLPGWVEYWAGRMPYH